jgi:ABC-type polysaccharide/polyol phosphate transport system ATPase subunit
VAPVVVFENVSKKFRRGERHDSLRDLVPSVVRHAFRRRAAEVLEEQEFWALRNVSFTVAAGQAIGIIGANGAGKSTTLKLLTRILKPTGGHCHIAGRVGALIEVAAGFHPDLTGRENIFLQGAIMGMKRAEIAQRFDEIVEFAGVEEFVDTPIKRYSSGMNARLGFSIAAHLRPDALIIDEVLSVGDMAFQQKCFDRMIEFKRQGIAIVLVSHNLQAVGALCENAIYLASRVKASGPTAEVIDAYVRTSTKVDQRDGRGTAEITSVSLIMDDGTPGGSLEIPAGTHVTLRVSIRTVEPFDNVTFGFLIYRSADQLLVYNGHIQRSELGPPEAFVGEFTLDLAFRANVVRGHYYVTLNVFHNPTQVFLIPPFQVATLAVSENRSRAGIADVGLSAEMKVTRELSHRSG